jgi:hypothetical protein
MRRMRARSIAVALPFAALLLGPAVARADGPTATGFGIGIESTLTGLAGPSFVYQADRFHIVGIVGYHDHGAASEMDLAGRFWWSVSATAASDFAIGGGIGIQNVDLGPESETDIHLEAGAELRAFLAPNFALSAALGLAVQTGDDPPGGDADEYLLGGQLVGTLGLTYFFF